MLSYFVSQTGMRVASSFHLTLCKEVFLQIILPRSHRQNVQNYKIIFLEVPFGHD